MVAARLLPLRWGVVGGVATPCVVAWQVTYVNGLTPPPETSKLRRSRRIASNISIAMMFEQGPETYCAAVNAEDAEQ